jgi:hypothetical protein
MAYPKSRLGPRYIKKSDLLRELDPVLNAIESDLVTTSTDGSITSNDGNVQVGVLATDSQHGTRGGGATHTLATTTVAGFMSATDKDKLDNLEDPPTVISTTVLQGSGANTLWSLPIPAATIVLVAVDAVCYTGTVAGIATKEWVGTLVCVVSRAGSSAPVIVSQTACVPWALTDSRWNPVFDLSVNTLRLRMTSDTASDVICTLEVSTKSRVTSDSPGSVLTEWQLLLDGLQSDIPGKIVGFYAGPDYTLESPGVVATVPGLVGSTLENSTAGRFALGTLGGYTTVTGGTLGVNKSLDSHTSVSFQSIWVVTEGHSGSGMDNFEELAAGQASGQLVRSGTTNNWIETNGETHYTDGVLSSAIPTSGIHIFEGNTTSATVDKVRVGGHSAAARVWARPWLIVMVLSATATITERATAVARLKTKFGIV